MELKGIKMGVLGDSICGSGKPAPQGTLYDYVDVLKTVTRKYSIPFLDMLQVGGMTPKV